MALQKLEQSNAFVIWDLPDAERTTGPIRLGPKILQSQSKQLARAVTYKAALLGTTVGGAAAGINTEPDGTDDAIAAFGSELAETLASSYSPYGGWGVPDNALATITGHDVDSTGSQRLVGLGIATATRLARGDAGFDGCRIAVIGGGPHLDHAASLAEADGATITKKAAADADADVVWIAGRYGGLDHDGAVGIQAAIVVECTDATVTPRALADLSRAGKTVVPSILATVGDVAPAACGDGKSDSAVDLEATVTSAIESAWAAAQVGDDNLYLAICKHAEAHLATWQDPLPFGRPLP